MGQALTVAQMFEALSQILEKGLLSTSTSINASIKQMLQLQNKTL